MNFVEHGNLKAKTEALKKLIQVDFFFKSLLISIFYYYHYFPIFIKDNLYITKLGHQF